VVYNFFLGQTYKSLQKIRSKEFVHNFLSLFRSCTNANEQTLKRKLRDGGDEEKMASSADIRAAVRPLAELYKRWQL